MEKAYGVFDCSLKGMKRDFFLLLFLLTAQTAFAWDAPESSRVRALFVGDVMAHKEQIQGARGADSWNFSPQFRRVKSLFENALVTGNLETVFAGEKSGFAGYPSFNTPDALADALAALGVSVVTLANNHILDRGLSGAARTTEVLDNAGLLWTGLGYGEIGPNEALTLDYKGIRWAFVNYSYGSNRVPKPGHVHLNTISDAAVTEGLLHARLSSPDIVVACFHWGNEYQFVPTRHQRELAALSFRKGADLVIGTHPHVLQPIEITSSDQGYGLVAYSLGNFVSYQRTLPRERSIVLAVDVEKENGGKAKIARVSAAPTWISATRSRGAPRVEAVYAGESPRFNHAGLPGSELEKARSAGKAVLEFLGASGSADAEGFYTLWDAKSPDVLPKGRRKSPQ